MDKGYREIGIECYGDRCEICGHSSIEVHHIDYQEHQAMENKVRNAAQALIFGDSAAYDKAIEEAKKQGYLYYDKKSRQLSKSDSKHNLSCLCGNCHTLMHKMDVGKKLLKAIKPRIHD